VLDGYWFDSLESSSSERSIVQGHLCRSITSSSLRATRGPTHKYDEATLRNLHGYETTSGNAQSQVLGDILMHSLQSPDASPWKRHMPAYQF
jgi:hypothetical protein